jgi:hypothetical protein
MNQTRIHELELQVAKLEEEVRDIRTLISNGSSVPWWRRTAGMFKDDPVFEEIMQEVRKNRRADYAAARAEFSQKCKSKGRGKKGRPR